MERFKLAIHVHNSEVWYNYIPHEVWDVYVFDWFEAAAPGGCKMCYQIFVRDLAPSIFQRSQWYFAHTYLGWHIFALFSQSIFVIPNKLVARDKRHLVCEFDLKRPWPFEMATIFRVWNCVFALLHACMHTCMYTCICMHCMHTYMYILMIGFFSLKILSCQLYLFHRQW